MGDAQHVKHSAFEVMKNRIRKHQALGITLYK
jgi:hypothetical protein